MRLLRGLLLLSSLAVAAGTPASCQEQERANMPLPSDISSKLKLKVPEAENAAVGKPAEKKKSQSFTGYKFSAANDKSTYRFVNKEADKPIPKRWKTPSAPKASTKADSAPAPKTEVKKLKINKASFMESASGRSGKHSFNQKTADPGAGFSPILGTKKP